MELRSLIGLGMLWPLIRPAAGSGDEERASRLAVMRNIVHYGANAAGCGAHPDPDRAGRVDRVHHADLDGDPGGRASSASAWAVEEHRRRARLVGGRIIVRPFGRRVGTRPRDRLGIGRLRVSVIVVKALTRTDRVIVILFWMVAIQSVAGLVPALLVWRGRRADVGAGWW
jgi:hypothetical protein